MTTDIIDINSVNGTENRFSWQRVVEFAGIYRDIIKRQLLVYAVASLLITILTLIPSNGYIQTGFYSLFNSILSLMYYFSPLILCKFGDFRPIIYMTPAKPSEKTVFYVIYFLIILPLVVYLLPWVGWALIYRFPEIASPELASLVSISIIANKIGIFSSIAQSAAIIITCLYVVLSARNNRLAKGIITILGAMLAYGIIGVITGIVVENQTGFGEAFFMTFDERFNTSEVQGSILDIIAEMQRPLSILFVVLSAYTILMIWIIYRRLCHPKI